jgi:hypothetical protein
MDVALALDNTEDFVHTLATATKAVQVRTAFPDSDYQF